MNVEENFSMKEEAITLHNKDVIKQQRKQQAARNVIIPMSMSCLERGYVSSNVRIQSISIPSSVKYLGQGALEYCSSLQYVTIPDSVTYVGSDCFNSCRSLKTLIIPQSVFSIRANAFADCTSLESIIVPEAVTFIEDNAFADCTSLKSIVLPKELMLLGRSVFDCCTALDRRCRDGRNYQYSTEKWLQRRFDGLPMHRICYQNLSAISRDTFATLVKQHRETLHLRDAMNMTPLHILHCNPTASTEMMHMLRFAYPEATGAIDVNRMTPIMLFYACKSVKTTYYFDSVRNGPSLCTLLNQGVKCDDLLELIRYDDEMVFLMELKDGDRKETGLYPFMSAAGSSHYSLDVVFELVLRFPDVFRRFVV